MERVGRVGSVNVMVWNDLEYFIFPKFQERLIILFNKVLQDLIRLNDDFLRFLVDLKLNQQSRK